MPILIAFAGLPGTGKTTVAREVARRCGAVYLRIDEIEQALRAADVLRDEVGPSGYVVAYALARSNLALGRDVVADSVNPLAVTRRAWHDVAVQAGAAMLDIEMVCSDPAEHRRRVEARVGDVAGLQLPSYMDVVARDYEPWTGGVLQIDTTVSSVESAVAMICAAIGATPSK